MLRENGVTGSWGVAQLMDAELSLDSKPLREKSVILGGNRQLPEVNL